ncbi:MAG: T9SS type A sorting domain-containing protein [Ignavibacteria bacterium]
MGEEVSTLVKEYKNAGNYDIDFNAGDIESGVYFYRLVSGSSSSVKKLIVVK